MAKLIFIGEKFSGRAYTFALEKTTVGRGDQNALTIHDASVSHSHAEILVHGTEVIVCDLGSSNGTFVNGVRLHGQQRPLHAGQMVRFGSVEARLEFESSSASETDTVTDVTAVYSHARHQREQQPGPKPPGPAPLTPNAGTPSKPDDHTLVLPRTAQATEKPTPLSAAIAEHTHKPSSKATLALVVAAIVIGLAIICWLVLVKNR